MRGFMVKNGWITATKVLIWILFAVGLIGITMITIKSHSMALALDTGSWILLFLFILSLILHFKPKKWVISFILGFIAANFILRMVAFFQVLPMVKAGSVPGGLVFPLIFWILYDVVLIWVAYKAFKTMKV